MNFYEIWELWQKKIRLLNYTRKTSKLHQQSNFLYLTYINMAACSSLVSDECRGSNKNMLVLCPNSGWSLSWSWRLVISAIPGRKIKMVPVFGKLLSADTIQLSKYSIRSLLIFSGSIRNRFLHASFEYPVSFSKNYSHRKFRWTLIVYEGTFYRNKKNAIR